MAPSTLQLGLLTLAGSALAMHPNGYRHSRYHNGQTGNSAVDSSASATAAAPYGFNNGTQPIGATGTGTGYGSVPTSESVSAPVSSASGYDAGSETSSAPIAYNAAASPSADTCAGRETVYETVQHTVTVTGTAGGEYPSSIAEDTQSYTAAQKYGRPNRGGYGRTSSVATTSSAAPAYVAPQSGSSAPVVSAPASSAPASSAPAYSAPSSSAAAPSASSAPAYSAPASSAPAYTSASASSAAPSQSSTCSSGGSGGSSSGGSSKRGCLYNDAGLCSQLSGVTWGTNWCAEKGDLNVPYAPQLWGKTDHGNNDLLKNWKTTAQDHIDNGAIALLGFNEPERGDQANLTPDEGASIWTEYMAPFKGSCKLASPGVSSNQDVGIDWLKNFGDKVGYNWDITAVHFYQDCTQSPEASKGYLDDFFDKAYNLGQKPIWVTELGCGPGASSEQMSAWMKYALEYFDSHAHVEKYAWAMAADVTPNQFPAALFNNGSPNEFADMYATSC